MSASPRLSMASRVDSSGIALKTRRFTLGVLRQYVSLASRTSSTPGVKETNLYGAGPDRRLREAVVADAPDVLLRHHPAGPGRHRAVEGQEVGPRAHEPDADT